LDDELIDEHLRRRAGGDRQRLGRAMQRHPKITFSVKARSVGTRGPLKKRGSLPAT
jgi:hypothetical protein